MGPLHRSSLHEGGTRPARCLTLIRDFNVAHRQPVSLEHACCDGDDAPVLVHIVDVVAGSDRIARMTERCTARTYELECAGGRVQGRCMDVAGTKAQESESERAGIERWEAFFNAPEARARLVARYV